MICLKKYGEMVKIYDDGYVIVRNGGKEMGKGMNKKMIKVERRDIGI